MCRSLKALAAGLAGLVFAAGAAYADTLPGHVAGWVARATAVDTAPDATPVVLSVYLKFSNQAALDALVAAQTSGNNPQHGHFLTPGQFRTQFGPPASSVAAV